jgi:dTDP-4-dehydrorhamnose reductase
LKVLILGGAGQVARAVAAATPMQHSIAIKSRAELDIADSAAVAETLNQINPDWIVNAAAYTAVDLAEDHPEQASLANDIAVGLLAKACQQMGGRLLHLSTDFVFDGQSNRAYLPNDPTGPLGVYGTSKLAGERQVSAHNPSGVILRTSWVYAASGRNFVLTMLRLMREKPLLSVVCDQIGAPTWASGMAEAIWGLIDVAAPGGIYHWTDLGVASWYDFAVAIQDEGLAAGLLTQRISILPVPTSAYPTRARRPPFSVLDTQSTRAIIKLPGNHWRHNLRRLFDELRAA